MAKHQTPAKCSSLPASFCLVLLLAFSTECTASSRLLTGQAPVVSPAATTTTTVASPVTTTSTTAVTQPANHVIGTTNIPTVGPAHKPADLSVQPAASPQPSVASPAIPASPDYKSSTLNGATVVASSSEQPLTFYMHDIPSLTSLNTDTSLNGLNYNNNDDDNDNDLNINDNLFGTTTAIDGELTKGHETGSSVIGRAQGFYVPSSLDGTSQSILLTATFGEDGEYTDTLSFFGVYRSAAPESQVVVIGGTGKYESAKGFATIQTLQPTEGQTDESVGTLLQFTLHLY